MGWDMLDTELLLVWTVRKVCKFWGSHSSQQHYWSFKSAGIWWHVIGWAVSDDLRDCGTFKIQRAACTVTQQYVQKTWVFSVKGIYHVRHLEISVSSCLSQSVQYVHNESSVIVWVNGYLWKRFDTAVCIVLLQRSDGFITLFVINILVVSGRTNCELLADVLVATSWNILSTCWRKLRKLLEFFVQHSEESLFNPY